MASGSLLDKVAKHETALLAELATAEAEAQRIIDEAHTKASAHLQEIQNQVDKEIIEMRRKAAADRQATLEQIAADTERQVREIRDRSAGHLDSVKNELLEMVLPKRGSAS